MAYFSYLRTRSDESFPKAEMYTVWTPYFQISDRIQLDEGYNHYDARVPKLFFPIIFKVKKGHTEIVMAMIVVTSFDVSLSSIYCIKKVAFMNFNF